MAEPEGHITIVVPTRAKLTDEIMDFVADGVYELVDAVKDRDWDPFIYAVGKIDPDEYATVHKTRLVKALKAVNAKSIPFVRPEGGGASMTDFDAWAQMLLDDINGVTDD